LLFCGVAGLSGTAPLAVQAATGAQLRSAGITDTRALEQISPALSFQSSYSTTSTWPSEFISELAGAAV
jgi:hypothetical protein